jgi:hypothetical protein
MAGVGPKTTPYVGKSAQPPIDAAPTKPGRAWLDRRIALRATRQHGVVALRQLVALGLGPSAVYQRVASGRLHRVQPGVYAVGHAALAPLGRIMAAVLACGPGAVASHRTAAALHGLRPSSRTPIDVMAPNRRGRAVAGIDAHRATTLRPADVEIVDGIPCTSVARTLLDLAAVVNRRQLERAGERAEVLRVLDLGAIEELIARCNGHPGVGALRAVLAAHAPAVLTRSELEVLFLALCRRAGVPAPAVNAWVALPGDGFEVDFLWRSRRLAVETDGRETHLTRHAFERDRRRDQRLVLAGWRVVRFTWRQVVEQPATVEATLRALLAQAA